MALVPAFPVCPHCQQHALAPDPDSYAGRGRRCWMCGHRVYPERAAVQLDFDAMLSGRAKYG